MVREMAMTVVMKRKTKNYKREKQPSCALQNGAQHTIYQVKDEKKLIRFVLVICSATKIQNVVVHQYRMI